MNHTIRTHLMLELDGNDTCNKKLWHSLSLSKFPHKEETLPKFVGFVSATQGFYPHDIRPI